MQRICRHLFFTIYLCLSRDFVNQHSLCSSIYVETALKSREECIEFADLLFWRLSLCLSRDSLSRDTRSSDLCILFKSSGQEFIFSVTKVAQNMFYQPMNFLGALPLPTSNIAKLKEKMTNHESRTYDSERLMQKPYITCTIKVKMSGKFTSSVVELFHVS